MYGLCTYHQPSPVGGGGTPDKYNFLWGLMGGGGFEQSFDPAGGGNARGLVSVTLAPQGKQGTS